MEGNKQRGPSQTGAAGFRRCALFSLTPEQIKRLDDLKNHPIVFDEDCPPMTEEQLKQFRRVDPRTGFSSSNRFRHEIASPPIWNRVQSPPTI